jgi:hypothetical protein
MEAVMVKMKLVVWNRLVHVTDNWHSEAGVTAIASSVDAAWAALQLVAPKAKEKTPDWVQDIEAEDTTVRVWIFPDAGCC